MYPGLKERCLDEKQGMPHVSDFMPESWHSMTADERMLTQVRTREM